MMNRKTDVLHHKWEQKINKSETERKDNTGIASDAG